jgi:pimeloyl-ACP methyl ester carboxylesterase
VEASPVLLVHGGFHGSWCWERLIDALAGLDVAAEAVELPFTSFDDDVVVIEGALDRLGADGTPVVVVGHSLGGLHLTAATAGRDGHVAAAHLVYLTAALVDPAYVPPLSEQEPWDHLIYEGDLARPDPAKAPALFYSSCEPKDVAWALERVRAAPISSMDRPVADYPVAWRAIPSTYIVCTLDRMLPPEQQRAMAANAGTILELESDHSPFLSRTTELATMLAGIAKSVAAVV